MRWIAGSGRSGTTWVQDCVAESNDLRPIFEPLHPAVTPLGPLYANRALSPNAECPDLASYFRDCCDGSYRSWWTTYRGRRDLLFPRLGELSSVDAWKRLYRRWSRFTRGVPALYRAGRLREPLFKDIRLNLALGWLVRQLEARVVLIVRHPCAVVESQLRLGDAWDPGPGLRRCAGDAEFDEWTEGRYRVPLRGSLSRIEELTLMWIIENQLPVELARAHGYVVSHYEHLHARGTSEWERVIGFLGLVQVPGPSLTGRPSQQSAVADPVTPEASSSKWMMRLSTPDLSSIQQLLDACRCSIYDTSSPNPL